MKRFVRWLSAQSRAVTYARTSTQSIYCGLSSESPTWSPALTGSRAPGDWWISSSPVRGQLNRPEDLTVEKICNPRPSPIICTIAERVSILLLDLRRPAKSRQPSLERALKEKEMANGFGATSTTEDILAGINLRGKRILVTGVSAGLGVETARSLAAHGADVVGAARDLTKAEPATAHVGKDAVAGGGSLELVALDLASLASVRACADALLKKG